MAPEERGTLLDAPAGFGHLSMKLKGMGYDVTAGEIDPDIFVCFVSIPKKLGNAFIKRSNQDFFY